MNATACDDEYVSMECFGWDVSSSYVGEYCDECVAVWNSSGDGNYDCAYCEAYSEGADTKCRDWDRNESTTCGSYEIYPPSVPSTPSISKSWSGSNPHISWSNVFGEPEYNYEYYEVWRALPTSYSKIATLNNTFTSYTDTDFEQGTGETANYKIRAHNERGNSSYSNVKSFLIDLR